MRSTVAARRPLADVLTIREKQRLDSVLLSRNGAANSDPAEWRGAGVAAAGCQCRRLAGLCDFAMDDLSYEYLTRCRLAGAMPGRLEYQTWNGAKERYPDGVPDKVTGYLNANWH